MRLQPAAPTCLVSLQGAECLHSPRVAEGHGFFHEVRKVCGVDVVGGFQLTQLQHCRHVLVAYGCLQQACDGPSTHGLYCRLAEQEGQGTAVVLLHCRADHKRDAAARQGHRQGGAVQGRQWRICVL